MLAAEVECFPIAFGVEGGGGVHGHAADGVDSFGFRRTHIFVSFLFVVTAFPTSVFRCLEIRRWKVRSELWSSPAIAPSGE